MVFPCRREARRPKLEAQGPRAKVGFVTAYQEFASIQGTLFGFYGIQMVFDAWILLSTVANPTKMCRTSIVGHRICYYSVDAVDLK